MSDDDSFDQIDDDFSKYSVQVPSEVVPESEHVNPNTKQWARTRLGSSLSTELDDGQSIFKRAQTFTVSMEKQRKNFQQWRKHNISPTLDKFLTIGASGMIVSVFFWPIVSYTGNLYNFQSQINGVPTLVMLFIMIIGSFLSGSVPAGGSVVAFPTLTLLYQLEPIVALQYSLLYQTIGTTSGSIAMLYTNLAVEFNAVVYASIGSILGILFGFANFTRQFTPESIQMTFAVFWFDFVLALFFLNSAAKRRVFDKIPNFTGGLKWIRQDHFAYNSKALILICGGFVGGVWTSLTGSGADLCTFAVLTLFFRVNERVATPTSTIVMNISAIFATIAYPTMFGSYANDAVQLFTCSVPVVVFGAPLGAFMSRKLSRLAAARIFMLLQTVSTLIAILRIQPWSNQNTNSPIELMSLSILAFICGTLIFYSMIENGIYLMKQAVKQELLNILVTEKQIQASKFEWYRYPFRKYISMLPELESTETLVTFVPVQGHLLLYLKSINLSENFQFLTATSDFDQRCSEQQSFIVNKFISHGGNFDNIDVDNKINVNLPQNMLLDIEDASTKPAVFDQVQRHIIQQYEKENILEGFVESDFGKDYIWRRTISENETSFEPSASSFKGGHHSMIGSMDPKRLLKSQNGDTAENIVAGSYYKPFCCNRVSVGNAQLQVTQKSKHPYLNALFYKPRLTHFDPESERFWKKSGKYIAAINLFASVFALFVTFACWAMWGTLLANIRSAHANDSDVYSFDDWKADMTTEEYIANTALLGSISGLSGATFRIVNSFLIQTSGARVTTIGILLLLSISMFALGLMLTNVNIPFLALMLGAFLTGIAGGQFSSSNSNIVNLFPKKTIGLILGINAGIGNLGVSFTQFVLGRIISSPTPITGTTVLETADSIQIQVQNGPFFWIPLMSLAIIICFICLNETPNVTIIHRHTMSKPCNSDPFSKKKCRNNIYSFKNNTISFIWLQLIGLIASVTGICVLIVTQKNVAPTLKFLGPVVATYCTAIGLLKYWTSFKFLGKTRQILNYTLGIYNQTNAMTYTYLYLMTFGGFIGFAFAFSSILKLIYGDVINPLEYGWLGAFTGSVIRPVGGWLSDKYGGSLVTKATLLFASLFAIIEGVIVLLQQNLQGEINLFVPFLLCFLCIFAALGVGNGSVYQMIGVDQQLNTSNIGIMLGYVAAIGAYGSFIFPLFFRTLQPQTAMFILAVYFLTGAKLAHDHIKKQKQLQVQEIAS